MGSTYTGRGAACGQYIIHTHIFGGAAWAAHTLVGVQHVGSTYIG